MVADLDPGQTNCGLPKKKAIEFDRIRIQIIVQKMIPQCEKQDYLTSVYYLVLSSFLY